MLPQMFLWIHNPILIEGDFQMLLLFQKAFRNQIQSMETSHLIVLKLDTSVQLAYLHLASKKRHLLIAFKNTLKNLMSL